MQFETLKRSNLKRNIVIGVIVVAIISAIILNFTKAKYRVTQSIPLVNGTINYSLNDVTVQTYVNDVLASTFPTKGTATFESISCNNDASATFDSENWSIKVTNFKKKLKCSIYFKSNLGSSGEYILADKTISERPIMNAPLTENTNGKVYTTEDNDGLSYYFAGANTENWFYFAGLYWRVIRINGDGTVRLIYQGETPKFTGTGTQIGTGQFNSTQNDNAYEGYMYGTSGSSTYEDTHQNINSSTIKQTLDAWYEEQLKEYEDFIDLNAGFCNDRGLTESGYTNYTNLGYSTEKTSYSPVARIWSTNWQFHETQKPSLKCGDNDLFTSTSSSKGNSALSNPIGLITIDELIFAGAYGEEENKNFYLYTGEQYWTMSPGNYDGTGARLLRLDENGAYDCAYANSWLGIRPVINLDANLELEGKGTVAEPFIIKGQEAPELSDTTKYILADKEILIREDFDTSLLSNTNGTIFLSEDDDGMTYYFAGDTDENWVKFAGFYWRIIRINGDESIRLIYSGTEYSGPVETGSNTQVGTSAFNSSYGNNMYVGYMYQNNVVHGLQDDSTIKIEIDKWYQNNLTDYTNYLDLNAGFCNDREPSTDNKTSNGQGGTGATTFTYYGSYFRLLQTEGNSPTFKCKNGSDLFTVSTSNKGNKALTYPVGLITADEIWYAGIAEQTVSSDEPLTNYLNTGQNYWTMTPFYYYSSLDYISILSTDTAGGFNGVNYWANGEAGIRPVINLKSSVTLTGSGTISNPYVVEGAE